MSLALLLFPLLTLFLLFVSTVLGLYIIVVLNVYTRDDEQVEDNADDEDVLAYIKKKLKSDGAGAKTEIVQRQQPPRLESTASYGHRLLSTRFLSAVDITLQSVGSGGRSRECGWGESSEYKL